MVLTTTEKYALAVLAAQGRLSALQRQKQALYLTASCVWDIMQAKSATVDEKGRLRVSAPLPASLSYCRPVYERLAKKPMKPEKAALDYISALTNKRVKTLSESVANHLIDRSLLVMEQQKEPREAKHCHVDTAAIAEDIAVMQDMGGDVLPDQFMLAILLLESGAVKKMLNKQEMSTMKRAVKQAGSDFQAYISRVTKRFRTVKIIIWACIGAIIGTPPVLLW